jgi:hypothetical protein
LNVALDYDNTYTLDPAAWRAVIRVLKDQGHKVYVVTMRHEKHEGDEVKERLSSKVDGIFFTSRKAKKPFMYAQGIHISVWIDDIPFFVDNDAQG